MWIKFKRKIILWAIQLFYFIWVPRMFVFRVKMRNSLRGVDKMNKDFIFFDCIHLRRKKSKDMQLNKGAIAKKNRFEKNQFNSLT